MSPTTISRSRSARASSKSRRLVSASADIEDEERLELATLADGVVNEGGDDGCRVEKGSAVQLQRP